MTFLLVGEVLWEFKLKENIIQYLLPKLIISFLEVYKELMHCFISSKGVRLPGDVTRQQT